MKTEHLNGMNEREWYEQSGYKIGSTISQQKRSSTIVIKQKIYFANKCGQFECEKYFQKKPLIESLKSFIIIY